MKFVTLLFSIVLSLNAMAFSGQAKKISVNFEHLEVRQDPVHGVTWDFYPYVLDIELTDIQLSDYRLFYRCIGACSEFWRSVAHERGTSIDATTRVTPRYSTVVQFPVRTIGLDLSESYARLWNFTEHSNLGEIVRAQELNYILLQFNHRYSIPNEIEHPFYVKFGFDRDTGRLVRVDVDMNCIYAGPQRAQICANRMVSFKVDSTY